MASEGRRERIPELDGLRVLMIAAVSWFHIWQQSWLTPESPLSSAAQQWVYRNLGIEPVWNWLIQTGYIWVDGTILLSVFLLYLPWARAARTGEPGPDRRDFWFRRARRVLPAYYFILLCHLFFIAIPWRLYGNNGSWMVQDIFTHLTFTFTRFPETCLATPLGGAAWTLAILVQGYALFPFLALGVRKHPLVVPGCMLALCFGYRAWCLWDHSDYSMMVNQLINFLDVYVIGILCATGFDALRARREAQPLPARKRYLLEAGATVLFLGFLYGLIRMLQVQFHVPYGELQGWQMVYRPVFALCFGGLILTAPFALLPLRKLLGNPVTRFLAGISMNYYLIHQTVAVHLKTRLQIPWTEGYIEAKVWELNAWLMEGRRVTHYPNELGAEYRDWQVQYSWLCVIVSLGMAICVTYLVEKPGARLMDRMRKRLAQRRALKDGITSSSD